MYPSFNADKFFLALRQYDQAIWPLPILAALLGLMVILLALHRARVAGRFIASLLAVFWVWIGVEYHSVSLAPVVPLADLAGILFVVQGLLLFWHGVLNDRLVFSTGGGSRALLGGLILAYAMILYPLLGPSLTHGAQSGFCFGVAPTPTVIFTLGLYLWTEDELPWDLLVIPMVWVVMGSRLAWETGLPEDFMLLPAGAAVVWMALRRGMGRRDQRAAQATWQTQA
jgi:hypothetical protein